FGREAAGYLPRTASQRRKDRERDPDVHAGSAARLRQGNVLPACAPRLQRRGARRRRVREGAGALAQPAGPCARRWRPRAGVAHALTPGSFQPAPWLANRHLQTLYASLAAPVPRIDFRRERWDTPDGDFVDVDFVDGPAGTPWVHLFHGLEGSSNSPYARM